MSQQSLEQARQAVADARTAVLAAYRTLGVHGAAYDAYPGHGEASDSLGRALTEVSEAQRAIEGARPADMPAFDRPAGSPPPADMPVYFPPPGPPPVAMPSR